MACIAPPTIPNPTLGLGLSIAPPGLPSVSFNAAWCCWTIPLALVPPPLPFGPLIVNVAVLNSVNATIAAIQAYLDALPPDCPKA